jgi:hypothetical protein
MSEGAILDKPTILAHGAVPANDPPVLRVVPIRDRRGRDSPDAFVLSAGRGPFSNRRNADREVVGAAQRQAKSRLRRFPKRLCGALSRVVATHRGERQSANTT